MIKIFARPVFRFERQEDYTEVSVEGEFEDKIAPIIIAHLIVTNHEVYSLDEDGEVTYYGDDS